MGELADRMAATAAGLAAACPTRVVTRDYKDHAQRRKEDLVQGVLTLLSLGEAGYANLNGRAARDGQHRMLLTGQIKVGENDPGEVLEAAEFAMVEEVKAWLRALPIDLITLEMTGFRQSGQMERPYGWVAMDLEMAI